MFWLVRFLPSNITQFLPSVSPLCKAFSHLVPSFHISLSLFRSYTEEPYAVCNSMHIRFAFASVAQFTCVRAAIRSVQMILSPPFNKLPNNSEGRQILQEGKGKRTSQLNIVSSKTTTDWPNGRDTLVVFGTHDFVHRSACSDIHMLLPTADTNSCAA